MVKKHLERRKASPFTLERLGDEGWTEDVMASYYSRYWTRVKSGPQLMAEKVLVFDLLEEVVEDQTRKDQFVSSKDRQGKVLFSLSQFEG